MAKIGEEIIDLHGNIFKVLEGWEFENQVPTQGDLEMIFTKDLINNKTFLLVKYPNEKNYRSYYYSDIYRLYIMLNLKKIGYDESKDIRKAYLYGKRKSK